MRYTTLAAATLMAATALSQSSNPESSSGGVSIYGTSNTTTFGSTIFYPEPGLTINHADELVFSFFTNGTTNAILAFDPPSPATDSNRTASVMSSSSVAIGTDSVTFSFGSWPTPITSFPYAARFGVVANLSYGVGVWNEIYVTVTSTAGSPKVYASEYTTAAGSAARATATSSASSVTSGTSTAKPTSGAIRIGAGMRLAAGAGIGVAGMLLL